MKKFTSFVTGLLFTAMLTVGGTAAYAQEEGAEGTPSNGISFPSQTDPLGYNVKRRTVRIDDAVIGESKAFTISSWIYVNTTAESVDYTQFPLFGLTVSNSYGKITNADISINRGTFAMKINESLAGLEKEGTLVDGASNSLKKQEWCLLTLVVDDEAGKAEFYYDGKLTQTIEYTAGKILRAGEDLKFHLTNAYGGQSAAIKYDDLKIANRALTAEEVADLKYAYQTDNIPEWLAGYYSFDENTGTVNEYANLGNGGDYKAQVLEGTSGYTSMEFSGTLSSNDATGEGIVNEWAPYKYTVTVTTEGEGTVVLKDGETEVASGDVLDAGTEVTVTVTPEENFIVKTFTVNGESAELTEEGTYTFSIEANTTIAVEFSEDKSGVASFETIATTYDRASQSILTDGEAEISVYSLDGKQVASARGSELSVASLAKGLYIAIINDGQTVEKVKFCK